MSSRTSSRGTGSARRRRIARIVVMTSMSDPSVPPIDGVSFKRRMVVVRREAAVHRSPWVRCTFWCVTTATEESNRRLLRARDTMDRTYAEPLDIPTLARVAHTSPAHFSRTFRDTFGETPHRYLQRRRIERAMFLLRTTDRDVTDVCFDVGFTSLGSFSRTFSEIVGRSPSDFRSGSAAPPPVPSCFAMAWTRPSSFGEA